MDQLSKSSSESRPIYYFLFVNTKSGNKEGLKYSQISAKRLKYIFKNNYAYLEVFDLFNPSQTRLAFEQAKKLSQELFENQTLKNQVRLIICGGDGTIPWVLSCAHEAAINFENVSIGILPIGTGNDFSRSLGWGYKTIIFNSLSLEKLHQIVKKWNNATIGHYDVWDIEIDTFQGGAFYDIKDQIEHRKPDKILRRTFTNYFGIGLDARVVYSVEKKRGSSAFINKLLYTLVGARNFFKKLENMDKVVDSFKSSSLTFEGEIKEVHKQVIMEEPLSQDLGSPYPLQNKLIKSKSEEIGEKFFEMKKGYKGLVCLNCTSYMAGLRQVWMTDRSTNKELKNDKQKQSFCDGKLQFISFSNEIALALERIMRTGFRIAQGSGPFEIIFRQERQSDETFIEIDGQSVKVEKIKSIRVTKSIKYPNGQIKVLINDKL